MGLDIKKSQEDASVNFVRTGDFPGFEEARYVRRTKDYFIAYLSSQTGCKMACRMCHLTATGQTDLVDVSAENIVAQAKTVFQWYDQLDDPARIVHFSWMARGESFASQVIREQGHDLLMKLSSLARDRNLLPRFMFSTIMPHDIQNLKLEDIFPVIQPNIYYSIYSTNPDFKRRWMPKAMPVKNALNILTSYQRVTNKIIKLHWPFIKNQNDSSEDVNGIIDAVKQAKLRIDINIVRYNPYSTAHGEESNLEQIMMNVKLLEQAFPESRIKVVDRVGLDVKASCGTFHE